VKFDYLKWKRFIVKVQNKFLQPEMEFELIFVLFFRQDILFHLISPYPIIFHLSDRN